MSERLYRLTQAGREAWESQDSAVPADYRRILWLMDLHGQHGLIDGLVRHYPRNVLDEWLAEMEELGLISSEPGPELGSAVDKTLALDQIRLHRDVETAGSALARTGAYLAKIGRAHV